MHFSFTWELKANEFEAFATLSMFIGIIMCVGGIFWDNLMGSTVPHSSGYGWMQAVWIIAWGVYSLVAWYMQDKKKGG